MIFRIILIVSIFILPGCDGQKGLLSSIVTDTASGYSKGVFMDGTPDIRNGDSYSVGWANGCSTYTSILGEGWLRLNEIIIDADKMVEDDLYYSGFSDGAAYCTFYYDWDIH